MERRVSWTNNSSGHLGSYVYRAETLDEQNLPAPVATVDPVASGATAEWIDTEELAAGDYEYAVRDYDAGGEGTLSAVVSHTVESSLDTAQIGDEIGGGIYAGTHTDGTNTWHVIFAKQDGEAAAGLEWGNYGTTTGADDPDDGLTNQNLILASFDDGSADAFYYCRDYIDSEGNKDYYLPATNEMLLVEELVNMSHPEFSANLSDYRWCSTEYTTNTAVAMRFSDGRVIDSINSKSNTSRLTRPIRRVPV